MRSCLERHAKNPVWSSWYSGLCGVTYCEARIHQSFGLLYRNKSIREMPFMPRLSRTLTGIEIH